MAESVTCDGCGKTAPTVGLFGWWVVDRFGEVDMWTMTAEMGPWHFCDLACMQGWA